MQVANAAPAQTAAPATSAARKLQARNAESRGAVSAGSLAATDVPASVVVRSGPGTFQFATGQGPVVGRSGVLSRYRVAVEDGAGITASAFALEVERILSDPRSWTAGGTCRLQRVAGTAPAAFTVFLASPATSEAMCREDWLETERFTNCRLGRARS